MFLTGQHSIYASISYSACLLNSVRSKTKTKHVWVETQRERIFQILFVFHWNISLFNFCWLVRLHLIGDIKDRKNRKCCCPLMKVHSMLFLSLTGSPTRENTVRKHKLCWVDVGFLLWLHTIETRYPLVFPMDIHRALFVDGLSCTYSLPSCTDGKYEHD